MLETFEFHGGALRRSLGIVLRGRNVVWSDAVLFDSTECMSAGIDNWNVIKFLKEPRQKLKLTNV